MTPNSRTGNVGDFSYTTVKVLQDLFHGSYLSIKVDASYRKHQEVGL